MRRLVAILITALPLALGAGVAQADFPGSGGSPGEGGFGGGSGMVAVGGTVISVNGTAGTFVADAAILPSGGGDQGGGDDDQSGGGSGGDSGSGGGSGGGSSFGGDLASAPATTQVTITTDSSTQIEVNGESGSVSNMNQGDRFVALFNGSSSDTIQQLVASPAVSVFDQTPEQGQQDTLYAFVGSVTAVDPTAGTVTVNVTRSLPSSLVPAGSPPVPFTVSADTLVLGGSSSGGLSGGSINNVGVGDIVAGGLFAPAGETLAQIEAMPLRMLLDLPASSPGSSSPAASASAKNRVMARAVALLDAGGAKRTKHHGHSRKHRKHTRRR